MNKDQESRIVDFSERCKAAIWGEFVGDALCLGSHWIYDLNELKNRFPEGVTGFEAPVEGHYHFGKHPGDFTHYGDAALLMLQSIADRGFFTPQDFGARFVALFSSPDYHGYLDHATKGTLENFRPYADKFPDNPFHFQAGADDDQPATATRLAPVVVAHAEDDELLRAVESATRVCQNNTRAVVYMKCHALIIEALLGGSGLPEAVKSAASSVAGEPEFGRELSALVEGVFGRLSEDVREVTLDVGQSCPLTSSFPAALHAAIKFQDDPRRAFLECANAGGDNAARCAMIGTWLGARFGMSAVPEQWRNRLTARQEIEQCIDRIVKHLES
ncbi:hypothetical protein GMST_24130 [Geomonas silvestris]|uniref:ADP-ribosylglycohydrolase n=1 Tax=Geomonas silvestris TaxID=2740184 RepID=A0A6V8MJD7_9BACT|nr:ADP-ribosylglycohydrolase family protein [Geomonas silvestris]GFO60088.1 hypothetical protein GMST_24130 [Geomonas silvestris]